MDCSVRGVFIEVLLEEGIEMNTQQMMEEIDRLARLCEAKDAEIDKVRNSDEHNFERWQHSLRQLSEAQAQRAMQAEAFAKARDCYTALIAGWEADDYLHQDHCDNLESALQLIPATSETVAAWRAKETEPLRREVATLVAWVKLSADGGYWTGLDDVEEAAKNLVENMQATALAYEREVKEMALEKFKADYKLSGYIVEFIDEAIAELRAASKGE